ncbi:MAG: DUF885 domain-containing protein, partial [Sphingomonadaceae bacterium]|nr:DUF885 domain-containing protein [Sphingomonadaceae bacterium]
MTARLLLAASLVALTACTTPDTAPSTAAAAPPPAAEAPKAEYSPQLKIQFAESDEANLKRNPISALFRGHLRYADRFGDYISDEYFAG